MKTVDFNISRRYSKTFHGKLRGIHFKSKGKVRLEKDGKLIVEYGNETLNGVSVVLGGYPEGKFRLTGEGRGYVELMDKNDVDYFDPTLHQSLIQVD